MSSFAIVVRVFDGEAPYLQSFIDHHRRLGVDAFYPVVAPGGAPLCREIFARNGIAFHESDGQRISFVQNLIREDYVAVIDADEYLHPDLFSFLDQEKVESLLMPWRLTASMDDSFFEAQQKRFFVFPQVKSIVKTSALQRLRLHASTTSGSGRCLGIEHCGRSALGLLKPSKTHSLAISPLILSSEIDRDIASELRANGSEMPSTRGGR